MFERTERDSNSLYSPSQEEEKVKKVKYGSRLKCVVWYFRYWGVFFNRKGDELLWIWPWKRKVLKGKFYVLGLEMPMESLKAIDKFWYDYTEAVVGDKFVEHG
jgi:hypothetical protein